MVGPEQLSQELQAAQTENALHIPETAEQQTSKWLPRKVAALAVAATLVVGGAVKETTHEDTTFAQPQATGQEVPGVSGASKSPNPPGNLSQRADSLVVSTSQAWAEHQATGKGFVDPVSGAVGGYGVAMIGQAMVETGAANNDQSLIRNGIQAELDEVNKPTNGGFEKFGLATAYMWNQQNLANNSDWQNAQSQIADFLRTLERPSVGDHANSCYANEHCWNNLKLVKAFGDIELMAAGLTNDQSSAKSSKSTAVLNREVNTLVRQAARNTGTDARRLGSPGHFEGSGILSDPSKNPLAYHQMSAMILGHTVEALGTARTPRSVSEAFQRSARATIGLAAPDGDGAYIGRGQGQVWNVAAEVDALSMAARYTDDPMWRGRYLAGADRALDRLESVYTPGSWGMPLTPRLAGDTNPNYLGIDYYANTVEYNGLALWALKDAVKQLRLTKPAPQENIGADTAGAFIDPSHTRFATVRKGDLWWAIHAADTHVDARYDFGLIAAERQSNGIWQPAIPYRPLTKSKTSGGPVLSKHGEHLVPIGRNIKANASGVVTVKGGWAMRPNGKPSVDTDTEWVFRPAGENGVSLAFQTKGERTYKFQTWYQQGSEVTVNKKGINVNEPNGRHESYTLNKSVEVRPGPVYHSAYDENLASSILTVHTNKAEKIKYTTEF